MAHRTGHAQGEEDAIRHVAARLTRQFPDLPADEVERAVYGKYSSFDDSPVRDFVPVLVERASRGRLAERRTGRHRA
jgi:hypothetical protein